MADVLQGKPMDGKIVDMGWWCDVPHINERLMVIFAKNGAKGAIVGKYADYWLQTKIPDNFILILRDTELTVTQKESKVKK